LDLEKKKTSESSCIHPLGVILHDSHDCHDSELQPTVAVPRGAIQQGHPAPGTGVRACPTTAAPRGVEGLSIHGRQQPARLHLWRNDWTCS